LTGSWPSEKMTIIEVSFFYMRHSITYKNCTLPFPTVYIYTANRIVFRPVDINALILDWPFTDLFL
ncbi:MAG: hypothetical protein ACOX8A_08940, partial [Thermacetogeniaceae bacterium]|jgi:hypothetical protein